MGRTESVTQPSAASNLKRLDTLLNERIGDATTIAQIQAWTLKRDFKRDVQHLGDEDVERAAGRLLARLSVEAA